jgi:hypothetical protein
LTPGSQYFKNLGTGDAHQFFMHVSYDVDWIVEGAHLLASHYRSKLDPVLVALLFEENPIPEMKMTSGATA